MQSKEFAIQKVKFIEEYCNTYKLWPKFRDKKRKIKNGISSNQLAWWLHTSGYNKGSFCYADVQDENGVYLKDKLDKLHEKYKNIRTFDEEYIIKMVDNVEEYCQTYKQWPQQKNYDKKIQSGLTSAQLNAWLYTSGYMTGSFKYKNIVTKDGKSLLSKLNWLFGVYGHVNYQSDRFKVKMVDLIEEYCNTYKEWPVSNCLDKKTNDGTTSQRLAIWLINSGYVGGKFRYESIMDQNGISLKKRLDDLADKYECIVTKSGEYSKIKMVEELEEYCDTYQTWPVPSNTTNKTKSGMTSRRIYGWLYSSGYGTDNFKYADLKDKNEVKLKDRLDYLQKKYTYVSRISEQSKINMVNLIEEYCELHNEWPKESNIKKTTKDGITSNQLARWLVQSGYGTDNFKYGYIVDKNKVSLKDRLDSLYRKYHQRNKARVLMVDLIEEYCNLYKEWPINKKTKNKTANGTSSAVLARWLDESGYTSSQFKYAHVVDENGIDLKTRLDKIYEQCLKMQMEIENSKTDWIDWLEEYCQTYQSLPKQNDKETKIKNGISSQQLWCWLYSSGYLTNSFKYNFIIDEDGMSLTEKIDRLFIIFSNKNQIKKIDNPILSNLNLTKAKDSNIFAIKLYYLIIQLKLSLEKENSDEIEYYKALIKSSLVNNNVLLDVEELINIFSLQIEQRRNMYLSIFDKCYKENNQVLAITFRMLYEYEKAFSNKTREKIKCKRMINKDTSK